MKKIHIELRKYIEAEILPRYTFFDKGHSIEHAEKVIHESLRLSKLLDVNLNMVYTIAAYHDVGLINGRKLHHIYSGEILQADTQLRQWFSDVEINIMREAVEDHRASNHTAPRSIYGSIVAEADRDIAPQTIIRRTIQYGLKKHPEMNTFEEHYERAVEHIEAKYGKNGYLKLHLNSNKNIQGLTEIRKLLIHKNAFRKMCMEIFEREKTSL